MTLSAPPQPPRPAAHSRTRASGHRQDLIPIDEFCNKIEAGQKAKSDPDFMIIARMESLIAGWGHEEAISRAKACCDAGADASGAD